MTCLRSSAYPLRFPIRFVGWPTAIRMTCGKLISAPYSYGSRVILHETPKSGIPDGEYTIGESIPNCFKSYSDTGSDNTFNLLLAFDGYGWFYTASYYDYWILEVQKRTIIVSNGIKFYPIYDTWYTQIPKTTDLSSGADTFNIYATYIDQGIDNAATTTISGELYFNGISCVGIATGGVEITTGVNE